jgi:hypothetical protein
MFPSLGSLFTHYLSFHLSSCGPQTFLTFSALTPQRDWDCGRSEDPGGPSVWCSAVPSAGCSGSESHLDQPPAVWTHLSDMDAINTPHDWPRWEHPRIESVL